MLDPGVLAGGMASAAKTVNMGGQVVGSARNARTGANRTYLLSPVPEPGTWARMLAGLGGNAHDCATAPVDEPKHWPIRMEGI